MIMRNLVGLACMSVFLVPPLQSQDVASGPEKGGKVPALKVFDVTGVNKDKEADYAAERKGKPTVYLLINAEKFDRPMNRFMKTLDAIVTKEYEGAYVVAVWLTADADKTKALLARVQQSVHYESTALTLFADAKEGPKGWGVNMDAHLTAVVVNKDKIVATFGYGSINETDVPKVKEALRIAIKGK
jgi:hypothetical protein